MTTRRLIIGTFEPTHAGEQLAAHESGSAEEIADLLLQQPRVAWGVLKRVAPKLLSPWRSGHGEHERLRFTMTAIEASVRHSDASEFKDLKVIKVGSTIIGLMQDWSAGMALADEALKGRWMLASEDEETGDDAP